MTKEKVKRNWAEWLCIVVVFIVGSIATLGILPFIVLCDYLLNGEKE